MVKPLPLSRIVPRPFFYRRPRWGAVVLVTLISLLCAVESLAEGMLGTLESVNGSVVQDESVSTQVIAYLPATEQRFVGSPSITKLEDGTLVASHDLFGPGTQKDTVFIYRSTDAGKSWKKVTELKQFWSGLFQHQGKLYLMGVGPGDVIIRRSDDGGLTWTEPTDRENGLLTEGGHFHTSSMAVVVAKGRIWRAVERSDQTGLGGLQARMMSAPEDADLLHADSWTISDELVQDRSWMPHREFRGWLEGNAVVDPDGNVCNMLRVHSFLSRERAAIIHYDDAGKTSKFDPEKHFVFMPGGAKKFNVKYDEVSKRYWTLSNWVPFEDAQTHPARYRNRLALCSSPDLRQWYAHRLIFSHHDWESHGFQYADWIRDGDDMLAAIRVGMTYNGEEADNYHNANTLLFLRIPGFRQTCQSFIDRY